ncbi:hypothetical protein JNJ66_03975 [Candidatus Saccharibacteria bacterium]|nr:hypothetical protein [Candidatus Saccharibacteria bacterium]
MLYLARTNPATVMIDISTLEGEGALAVAQELVTVPKQLAGVSSLLDRWLGTPSTADHQFVELDGIDALCEHLLAEARRRLGNEDEAQRMLRVLMQSVYDALPPDHPDVPPTGQYV